MTKILQKDVREYLSKPLTWHWIGFVALLILVIFLAVNVGLDWHVTHGSNSGSASGKQALLHSLEQSTSHMRGLDKRVDESKAQVADFYLKRIPVNYSTIATHIGNLQVQSGVRMTRLQYTQKKPSNKLTEVSMDASISGSYLQIMKFINGVERDETFFVIRTIALTGQQSGQVNLHLTVSTWLREADAAAALKEIPPADVETQGTKATAPRKEGV